MDLSDEQKRRIFEEEQQRVAEEKYRLQIRQELSAQAPNETPTQGHDSRQTLPNARPKLGIFLALFISLVVAAAVIACQKLEQSIEASERAKAFANHADIATSGRSASAFERSKAAQREAIQAAEDSGRYDPTGTKRPLAILQGILIGIGVLAIALLFMGQRNQFRPSVRFLFFAFLVVGIADGALFLKGFTQNVLVMMPLHNETVSAESPTPQGTAPPTILTTAQIARQATPSVVVIESLNEDGVKLGQGSGYAASDGVVITNYHVIRGASSLVARAQDGQSARVESILGYDVEHDLAALKTDSLALPKLAIEDPASLNVGDKVVAIGSPLGLQDTVSEGIISALRDTGGVSLIQTTTAISPGSSGGPLLNTFGHVVSLTAATMNGGQNLNMAISARHIKEILDKKREMTLASMVSETRIEEPLPASTFNVPPRSGTRMSFAVQGQQGAVLEGTYRVAGGTGSDIDIAVLSSDNQLVFNGGRVREVGQLRLRLPKGSYFLIFGNTFSTFSAKSVSPDLKLVFFK